jgi:general secretion pathway protein K
MEFVPQALPMMFKHHPRPHHTIQGIALVIVLWMLVLLTVIANNMVFSSRTEVLAAANMTTRSRAEAAADAGVFMAIQQLASALAPQSGTTTDVSRLKADALTRSWQFQDALLTITIIDESGKIDINTAPQPLLLGLFIALGVEQTVADSLADAVIDWRDPDDLRQLHGAEKDDYAAAGLNYGPANASFDAIEELRQVMGMSDSLFARLESLITVNSRQVGVNTAFAPREVLLALPGTTPEQVDLFIEQRRMLLEQGLPAPPFGVGQGLAAATAGAYSIQVDVLMGDNVRFSRQAVARLTGNPKDPVAILAWRTPLSAPSPLIAPPSAQP